MSPKNSSKKSSFKDIIAYIFLALIILGLFGGCSVNLTKSIIAHAKVNKLLKTDDPFRNIVWAIKDEDEDFLAAAENALDDVSGEFYASVIPACSGEIISSAAYDPNDSSQHSLVLVFTDYDYLNDWMYEFLAEFGPDSLEVEDVQLVACASMVEHVVETCSYGYDVKRIRIARDIHVHVFEASTGIYYANTFIYGSEPNDCPSSLSSNSKETGYIYGGSWSKSDLEDFLSHLIQKGQE